MGIPPDALANEALIKQTKDLAGISRSSLLKLHENITLLLKRAELQIRPQPFTPGIQLPKKKQSNFSFQDRNDTAYNLNEFHSTILKDLQTVQSAVLDMYVKEFCQVTTRDFSLVYSSGDKVFLNREFTPLLLVTRLGWALYLQWSDAMLQPMVR